MMMLPERNHTDRAMGAQDVIFSCDITKDSTFRSHFYKLRQEMLP